MIVLFLLDVHTLRIHWRCFLQIHTNQAHITVGRNGSVVQCWEMRK
jgi:hypothetical protein